MNERKKGEKPPPHADAERVSFSAHLASPVLLSFPQVNEGQHAHLPSLTEEDRALVMNQYSQFRSMIEEALQNEKVRVRVCVGHMAPPSR